MGSITCATLCSIRLGCGRRGKPMHKEMVQFIGRILCLACTAAVTCLGADSPAPLGPIAIRNGSFVSAASGRRFAPRDSEIKVRNPDYDAKNLY